MKEIEELYNSTEELLNLPFQLEWGDFDSIMDNFKLTLDEL